MKGLPITIEQRLPYSFDRRVFRYCYRFMDAYRVGLTGAVLDYTVKKFQVTVKFLLMPLEKTWKQNVLQRNVSRRY